MCICSLIGDFFSYLSCDIDMRDNSMTSPLHLAVQNRRNDVVEVLLQRWPDSLAVNVPVCIYNIFLYRGVTVMVSDAAGKTPLEYALQQV